MSRVASPTEPVHELVQEALGEEEKSRRFVFGIDFDTFDHWRRYVAGW